MAARRFIATSAPPATDFTASRRRLAAQMYPQAPQLWEKHRNGEVVGVSDDPPGETYWRVANGIRLTGMPSYKKILTDTQMWQVTLLLANANKPLPPAVVDIVNGKTAAAGGAECGCGGDAESGKAAACGASSRRGSKQSR